MKKKEVKQKKDLIPLALYQIMYMKYEGLRKLEAELTEHLEENYELKDKEKWDFNSIICDSLYQEEDTEEFLKCLKEHARRKK